MTKEWEEARASDPGGASGGDPGGALGRRPFKYPRESPRGSSHSFPNFTPAGRGPEFR